MCMARSLYKIGAKYERKINKWTGSNSPGKYWGVETFVHNKCMYKLICRRDAVNHHTV